MQFILSADGLMFQTLIKYPPIEIPQAQTTFISGDSGSGKSTLFKLFNATVSPSKGTILYQGKNISAIDTKWRMENAYQCIITLNTHLSIITVE